MSLLHSIRPKQVSMYNILLVKTHCRLMTLIFPIVCDHYLGGTHLDILVLLPYAQRTHTHELHLIKTRMLPKCSIDTAPSSISHQIKTRKSTSFRKSDRYNFHLFTKQQILQDIKSESLSLA